MHNIRLSPHNIARQICEQHSDNSLAQDPFSALFGSGGMPRGARVHMGGMPGGGGGMGGGLPPGIQEMMGGMF